MTITLEAARISEIVTWLRNESEERMKQAAGRRDGADCMRNATESELKAGKRLAEKMSGYKLNRVTTDDSNRQQVAAQDRIVSRLEIEARKLAEWADCIEREMEANAKLIAAAPKLARTNEELRAALTHAHMWLLQTNDMTADCQEMCDEIAAALKRAEE